MRSEPIGPLAAAAIAAPDEELAQVREEAGQYMPMVRDLANEIAALPEGEIVRVEHGDGLVVVEQRGGHFRVDVDAPHKGGGLEVGFEDQVVVRRPDVGGEAMLGGTHLPERIGLGHLPGRPDPRFPADTAGARYPRRLVRAQEGQQSS